MTFYKATSEAVYAFESIETLDHYAKTEGEAE